MIEARERRLLIDGEPAIVMAGEVHYFRVPRDEWRQRIELAREVGCTAVASYIPWLFHELPDGTIDVDGATRPERDIGAFIDLCAELGLQFIARPGPFVMAELKNEGLPYRLYREHPEIVATGWDGKPVRTATVDYLSPAFLGETQRWYDAILAIVARRLHPDGNVIAVQLDNEIGMLAWVTNTPDLSDDLLADFREWCRQRYPDLYDRYPIEVDLPRAWRRAVESPDESWAGALRVDLGRFMRGRFARYVHALTAMAHARGIVGVPLLINIHGTEHGSGIPFGIGVSQLMETYAGVPGLIAGSDHYLGEMSLQTTVDMHFINAAMASVNDPDQPLTSLEFEAGTGDYGGGADQLYEPSTVDLKTRLCLAQGNKLISYYLLAGGINPPLDERAGDGNDRISFTGERHGTAAPVGPEGQRALTFEATRRTCAAVATNARWLADQTEEHDDLAMAFLPDAFATEYHHPDSLAMTAAVNDLTQHRGLGDRRALWHSLLLGGFRFSAVNLQDSGATLPMLVALGTGRFLDAPVQRRLVDHLGAGGRILLLGPLPERDLEGKSCAVLAEALGLRGSRTVRDDGLIYPSVRPRDGAPRIPETRVSWLQELRTAKGQPLDPADGVVPLLEDVDGRPCAVEISRGDGRATIIAAGIPKLPPFVRGLVERLGVTPGLDLETRVPGVAALTSRSSNGDRMLHLLNPTGYDASVSVTLDGEALAPGGWTVPRRTGHMLALGLTTRWGRIERATSEVIALEDGLVRFGPSLAPVGHRIELRTERRVEAADDGPELELGGSDGAVVVSSRAAGSPLTLRLG